MTRDELIEELETILIGSPKTVDVMDTIDSYVATERNVIEQQIESHLARRLAAERERIAQAIEAEATKADESAAGQPDAVLSAGDQVAAIIFRNAARIARADS